MFKYSFHKLSELNEHYVNQKIDYEKKTAKNAIQKALLVPIIGVK